MSLTMPPVCVETVSRRREIAEALRAIVPGGAIDGEPELKVYESDGLTAYRQPPLVVALPETTEQVSRVLAWCHGEGISVVPRGAGTSLSGGALPIADGVLLGLSRMNQILDIDYVDRVAVVQPGVTNLAVTQAASAEGFYYAPDPSSQIACTIGVGVEKRDLMPVMFSEVDLDYQRRIKCAFDPDLRLNPGKVFPLLRRCAELGRMHVHHGALPFSDLPRFQ